MPTTTDTPTPPVTPMTNKRRRPSPPPALARAMSGAAVLAVAAGSALAQQGSTPLRPPTPGELEGVPMSLGIVTIIVTVLLAALVILAAVYPSKRGHQD